MAKTKIVYESNYDLVKTTLQSKCMLANRLILEDIHRNSTEITPMSKGLHTDGELREQVSKRVSGLEAVISWNVPYASYQERGMRFGGSHVITNYTTPGTGKEFAKRTVKEVVNTKNLKKYIKFGSPYT